MLCDDLLPASGCLALTYGIQRKFSFEAVLDSRGCNVTSLDPTVTYPSKLPRTNVTFLKVGAPMLGTANFSVASPMQILKQIQKQNSSNHDLSVLKMDCEGCEYALAKSVEAEYPKFFRHVQQFAVEVHLTRHYITKLSTLREYDKLLKFLFEAGHSLRSAEIGACGPHRSMFSDEGLRKVLDTAHYPYGPMKGCQNFLFVRD